MKYIDTVRYMEGIIVAVDDCSVSIDFKGRMGFMQVPRRSVITDYALVVGQEVALNMSYIEVMGAEPNEKYRSNLDKKNVNLDKKNLKEV